MPWTTRISLLCYGSNIVILLVFGLLYLFRPEFMPYHADAVGHSWPEVERGYQVLILALMKVTAGGFIATAFALAVMLYRFKQTQERWLFWCIPITTLITATSSLCVTLYVAHNTPANPPWIMAALAIVLTLAGMLTSRTQIPFASSNE